MRSRSYIFLVIVLALAALSGFFYSRQDFKLGLDVQGGVRFTYQMQLEELTEEQRQRLDTISQNLITVLTDRASLGLGVAEATVQRKGVDQIVIEIPGERDIDRARQILSTTASIKLYHARTVATERNQFRRFQIDEQVNEGGSPAYRFRLRADATKILEPGSPEYIEMIRSWGEPILEGPDLARAEPQLQGQDRFIPSMRFSPDGSRKIEQWSRRNMNTGENIAFVLDNRVLSIAPLRDGTILSGGSAVIEGTFDTEYVKALSDLLNAGALPVSLKEIFSERVDPTIGRQALNQIITAGAISFGVIALFLVGYYAFPGFVALVVLGLYMLFTLTVLKMIGATFSLAAIAGFILSVGMAVDANILVFERLKEELRNGKTLQAAIELGFKRALPAIVDSNACTILTSLVLMTLGSGPVRGFATTLILGVAISLFTAVVITRSLLMFLVGSGLGANPKWYGLNRQWFGEKYEQGAVSKPLQIVEKRNRWFLISILTIVPGLIAIAAGGIRPNVEFIGGVEGQYRMTQQRSTPEIVRQLTQAGVEGANVKLAGDTQNRRVYITAPRKGILAEGTSEELRPKLAQAAGFTLADEVSFTDVGPTLQQEMIQNAILGVIISSSLIVIYLAIRFGLAVGGFVVGLRFSAAAIIALLHDVLVVVGLAGVMGFLLGWEVSALFVTGMLTVIGFSTHDTIVIFDRIRENLRKAGPGEEFGHLVNVSITQSIARSINTSATVIVTLILLIFIGSATPDLQFFNFVMLMGIISGTYSSIWNASPILYAYDRYIAKKRGEMSTLLGLAQQEAARQRAIAQQVTVGGGVSDTVKDTAYGQVRRRERKPKPGEREVD